MARHGADVDRTEEWAALRARHLQPHDADLPAVGLALLIHERRARPCGDGVELLEHAHQRRPAREDATAP